jgi:two-component sensor histidine kinase
LPNESQSNSDTGRSGLFIFLIAWTILVALTLTWLLQRDTGPSVLIINSEDATKAESHDHFRGFFKSEIGLSHLCPWILFGPYLALLALRFPLERERLKVSVSINLLACIAFLAASRWVSSKAFVNERKVIVVSAHGEFATNSSHRIVTTNRSVVTRQIGGRETFEKSSTDASLSNLLTELRFDIKPPMASEKSGYNLWPTLVDFLAYGAIFGFSHSIHFYRRFRDRERRALSLESSLTRAQLDALRAQLQPHFLFNSLNAIVALLRRDPAAAETTLVSLSELLRLALSYSDRKEISLREELEFVHRYIDLQRTRFGEKLRFEQDVEPSALDALTPTLLLQPLVENAIRHGIEPSDKQGLLRLKARRIGDRLEVEVEDNGIGLKPDEPPAGIKATGGIGLKNLRARLQTLYGGNQKLTIVSRTEGGVRVRVALPWKTTETPLP